MNIEVITMILALLLMLAAVIAKIATSSMIDNMQQIIDLINHDKSKTKNALRVVQAQKEVAEKNQVKLDRKRVKLEKKKAELDQELASSKEGNKKIQTKSSV